MAEAKTEPKAETKDTKADTKEDKATKEAEEYGDLDARWTQVRSGEVYYVLPLAAPEVEEGEEPVPGGYILHNDSTGERKEISHDEYNEMQLQVVPPAKQL